MHFRLGSDTDNWLTVKERWLQSVNLRRHAEEYKAHPLPKREDFSVLPRLHEPLEQPALLAASVGATYTAPTSDSAPVFSAPVPPTNPSDGTTPYFSAVQ